MNVDQVARSFSIISHIAKGFEVVGTWRSEVQTLHLRMDDEPRETEFAE